MDKLHVLFVIALFSCAAFGQNAQTIENGEDLEDRASTMAPAVRSCIAGCPVTSEYNPVCGTDRVTYTNPGRLSCAQMCGVNVSLLRTSPCPTAQAAAAATK
ncbi:unnamed protein product [Chrysodeixis includens]|uniref:Kazal-like domain-containing protein n=1 Tax=Chrysodeixis includens TaxID=689277 RepID=A0A9N8KXV3_CHRIL|nr:unnamed protein product [Chrysodeixis includens]